MIGTSNKVSSPPLTRGATIGEGDSGPSAAAADREAPSPTPSSVTTEGTVTTGGDRDDGGDRGGENTVGQERAGTTSPVANALSSSKKAGAPDDDDEPDGCDRGPAAVGTSAPAVRQVTSSGEGAGVEIGATSTAGTGGDSIAVVVAGEAAEAVKAVAAQATGADGPSMAAHATSSTKAGR